MKSKKKKCEHLFTREQDRYSEYRICIYCGVVEDGDPDPDIITRIKKLVKKPNIGSRIYNKKFYDEEKLQR